MISHTHWFLIKLTKMRQENTLKQKNLEKVHDINQRRVSELSWLFRSKMIHLLRLTLDYLLLRLSCATLSLCPFILIDEAKPIHPAIMIKTKKVPEFFLHWRTFDEFLSNRTNLCLRWSSSRAHHRTMQLGLPHPQTIPNVFHCFHRKNFRWNLN